ncbi:hypothetical protein EJD97_017589 [Solanum chilense]|uniref:Uncharacterized protein n=1 Tax=Solanum chilense TaxID=4083 RepID=A0A6N2B2R5_SOLCI|nr:hypothetical protein EJD97_017589 [Solanum chilense]
MACNGRRHPTMCAAQSPCRHAIPYVVQLCVQSKGDDNMTCTTSSDRGNDDIYRLTLFDRVCSRRSMIAFSTPDVIQPCVLDKGYDCMPRPTYSNRVFCARAMMTCHVLSLPTVCCPSAKITHHTRLYPTTCAAQWPCEHATPDVIRLSVMSKGNDNMPRPTSSDRVFIPRAMMAFHTQRRPIVYAF